MKIVVTTFNLLLFIVLFTTEGASQSIPTDSLKLHLSADAGITSSGDSVIVWADQSGNGFNSSQAIPSNRPSYVANAINGEPAVRFNGIDDYFVLPSAADLGIVNNDYQIFIVAKTASVTSNSIYFLLGSASEAEQYEIHTNGVKGIRYIPDTGIYVDEGTSGDYTDSETHLFQVEATSTYGLVRMDGDGVSQINSDSRSEYAGNLIFGTRTGGVYWWNGDIAEIIIYNTILSESDRNMVEDYLKVKYNIDPPAVTPTTQSSNVVISEVESTSMKVSLTPGDGEQRVIIAKSGSSVEVLPVDATTYTGNSAFGSGTHLGSGNYVVYNGTGSEVTVTGLEENTTYYFKAFEYNGDPSDEKYYADTTASASSTTNFTPASVQSQTFVETTASSATFSAVVSRSSSLTTSYRVLWGTSPTSYSDSSSTIVKEAGASSDTVSFEITGLSDNTFYFARLRVTTAQENTISDGVPLFFNNTTIATDSLSLWLSADAGIPDIGNGESVSLWYDLSGKGNNATQTNASVRPVLNTNAINGKSVVKFNGSSSFLRLPDSQELGIVGKDYEIILVARSNNTYRAALIGDNYNTQYAPFIQLNNESGIRFGGNGSNTISAKDNEQYSDNNFYVFSALGTNTEGRIIVDYSTQGSSTGQDFRSYSNGSWYLGAALSQPSEVNSDDFLSGDIAEVIIYNKKLSSQERFDIHEYLSDKYNLDLPLGTPDEQVSEIQLTKTGPTSAKLEFKPGNGIYTLAILKQGGEVDALPLDSTTYIASAVFGSGTEIGTGNFVVGATSDSSITITGLTTETTYYASLISFNGDAGYERYLTTNPDTASLYFPPSVALSSVTPSAFSLDNETNTTIQLTFSDAMNTSTFGSDSSFTVRGSESGLHTGDIQFSVGNTIATFIPDSTFKPGEIITVGLTNKLQGDVKSFEDYRTYSFQIKTSPSSATFEKIASLDQSFTSRKTMVSDMNNDGLNDIIMLNRSSYSISIRLADSDSTFSEPDDFSAGDSPTSFAIADIDGDGDEDILISDDDSSVLNVMYNDGDGEFDNNTNYSLNDYSYSVTSGDLDQDGDLDVVIGIYGYISVLINDGAGSLSSPTDYSTNESENITEVAAVDIDGDGDTDILASDAYESFYMLKNNGDGTFESPQVLDTFDYPFDLVYGDIDGDGDVDVVLSSDDDSYIYVYKNNGNGTFASRVGYDTDDYGLFLSLNDIDGDGDLDILAGEEDDYYMYIYLNPGTGTFPSYTTFQLDYSIDSFTMSDLDMDGDLDLVISTYDSLFLYKNYNFDPLTISGTEGWRLLASPSGNITYSQLLPGLWTQGFTGASSSSGTSNVYYWDTSTDNNSVSNWMSISSIGDSVSIGSGALAYVYSDDNGPEEGDAGFPKTLSYFGSGYDQDIQLDSLLNTNENGWTLLGNPFFSDIYWDDFNKYDISNSVYVYDDTASSWKSWNGSVGSLTDGIIPTYSGFFVQSTDGSPNLEIPLSAQLNYNSEGERKLVAKAKPLYFSLQLTSETGFNNKAWFQFSESGEYGIDASDAYQLNPLSPNYVTMASIIDDTTNLDINSLPFITESYVLSLALQTTENGTQHSITKGDWNVPDGWEVTLYDSEQDVTSNLTEPYIFTMGVEKTKVIQAQNNTSPLSLESIFRAGKQKQAGARFTITISPVTTVNGEPISDLPQTVELQQNYPNPFNPSSVIQFGVPELSKVRLEVFDILGRKVATLLNNETKSAGRYNVQFDAGNLASGMYVYRLQVGNHILTKKMTLIK